MDLNHLSLATGVLQTLGLTSAQPTRKSAKAFNSCACSQYIRGLQNMAEGRGPDPHALRHHRFSRPCRAPARLPTPYWRKTECTILIRFHVPAGFQPVPSPARLVFRNGGWVRCRFPYLSVPRVFKARCQAAGDPSVMWWSGRGSNSHPHPSEGCAHPLSYQTTVHGVVSCGN